MNRTKRLCATFVAALVIAGAVAPGITTAQMQTPPPPAPMPPPPPSFSGPYQPTQGDRVGAGFLNVVYVPGKAIMCSLGTIASAGIMLLTFGSAYDAAVGIFNEGCGGKWALTPYDVAAKRPPDESY